MWCYYCFPCSVAAESLDQKLNKDGEDGDEDEENNDDDDDCDDDDDDGDGEDRAGAGGDIDGHDNDVGREMVMMTMLGQPAAEELGG